MTLMATAAKKATASSSTKVAAKKAVKKADRPARLTAPPKGAVEAAAVGGSTRPITFLGREILVEMPDENQILIWRKIIRQLQEEGNTKDPERLFVLMERGRRIVDSVIVSDSDVEWLDDMLLERKTDLRATVEIIVLAMRAHHPDIELPDDVAEIE